MSTIWPLPKITITALKDVDEKRPAALITSDDAWSKVAHLLDLPLVVQAEPLDTSEELIDYLAENLPSQVEVVYAVGNGVPVVAGKIVAHRNNVPLVLVPLALDSDGLFESFVERMDDSGLWRRQDAAPAQELIIDWEVIKAAPAHLRGAAIVDLLSIVTALLDWRYAARQNRTRDGQKFSAWGASVAAGLASQAIKSAADIGQGKVEAMHTLLDLLMISVQLANQLGHDRHQEGTEHYFAFSLRNQGAAATHAELVVPGILITSKLHGQDPDSIRVALQNAGLRLDQVRAADAQLAMNDLPNFCAANDFPFGIGHELDPNSDKVKEAMQAAGFGEVSSTGQWTAQQTGDTSPSSPTQEQGDAAPANAATDSTTPGAGSATNASAAPGSSVDINEPPIKGEDTPPPSPPDSGTG
jgi:glycerol-1-phosphate dehydrogenase [NAD(P)+]